jgi:hypothetical protein
LELGIHEAVEARHHLGLGLTAIRTAAMIGCWRLHILKFNPQSLVIENTKQQLAFLWSLEGGARNRERQGLHATKHRRAPHVAPGASCLPGWSIVGGDGGKLLGP